MGRARLVVVWRLALLAAATHTTALPTDKSPSRFRFAEPPVAPPPPPLMDRQQGATRHSCDDVSLSSLRRCGQQVRALSTAVLAGPDCATPSTDHTRVFTAAFKTWIVADPAADDEKTERVRRRLCDGFRRLQGAELGFNDEGDDTGDGAVHVRCKPLSKAEHREMYKVVKQSRWMHGLAVLIGADSGSAMLEDDDRQGPNHFPPPEIFADLLLRKLDCQRRGGTLDANDCVVDDETTRSEEDKDNDEEELEEVGLERRSLVFSLKADTFCLVARAATMGGMGGIQQLNKYYYKGVFPRNMLPDCLQHAVDAEALPIEHRTDICAGPRQILCRQLAYLFPLLRHGGFMGAQAALEAGGEESKLLFSLAGGRDKILPPGHGMRPKLGLLKRVKFAADVFKADAEFTLREAFFLTPDGSNICGADELGSTVANHVALCPLFWEKPDDLPATGGVTETVTENPSLRAKLRCRMTDCEKRADGSIVEFEAHVSRAMILLHEMTHALLATSDRPVGYQMKSCRRYAREDPAEAVNNAQSLAFYATEAEFVRGALVDVDRGESTK